MRPVVGVFRSRSDAEEGVKRLKDAGIPSDTITVITPHSPEGGKEDLQVDSEQPGMVKTLGAVAGGAAGLGIGEGLASLAVPGVGPVLAIGLIGGALLGALAGAAVGGASERALFSGVPADEVYVYKDALRQNRTIVVVMTKSASEVDEVRVLLERIGAESIDRARQMWWLGLRDVEKEHYNAGAGGNFERDEADFKRGFEAALQNGHGQDQQEQVPDTWNNQAYRQGFERGRNYAQSAKQK
jgi:hypothetical protein